MPEYIDIDQEVPMVDARGREIVVSVRKILDQNSGKYKVADVVLAEWNPAEKPPEDERNIFLCYGSPDFKACCIGHYEEYNKTYYEDRNWFASPIYDVMYWCEMPKLPLCGE